MPKAKTAETKLARKSTALWILAAGLIVIALPLMYVQSKNDCTQVYRDDLSNVRLSPSSEDRFQIEVVDTIDERVMGLSGRSCIKTNQAMLFSFELADKHSFWMKDMKFPIDIVWLDSDKKIVYIVENVEPRSYPRTYTPNTNAQYVLELKSGRSSEIGLKLGNALSW